MTDELTGRAEAVDLEHVERGGGHAVREEADDAALPGALILVGPFTPRTVQ